MKVVLDTNVFISGIFWKGASNRIIANWQDGKFEIISSAGTVEEIAKVLNDFKIRLPDEMAKEWIKAIVKGSIMVTPREKIAAVKDDPKDNVFIETAVEGKADYIVSQDNHLLKLKRFREIKIITPEEFNKMTYSPT